MCVKVNLLLVSYWLKDPGVIHKEEEVHEILLNHVKKGIKTFNNFHELLRLTQNLLYIEIYHGFPVPCNNHIFDQGLSSLSSLLKLVTSRFCIAAS